MLTSPSGKIYIGQTTRLIHTRLEEHRTGKSSDCVAIYNAIQFYGWDAFVIDWYEVPDGDLNKHEELMIEVLGTLSPDGYNLREGGGSHGKMSEETQQKKRETNSGEKNYKSKRVYQYDIDGAFINSFESTGEAGRHLEKYGANIRSCARGVPKYKTAYGFKWSYVKY